MDTDPKPASSQPSEPRPTRRETARRRVRILKVGASVAASGVFVAAAAAAHEAHPGGGGASTRAGSLTVPTAFAKRLTQSDDFGDGGSIGPIQNDGSGTPRTGTHTS
jgi:hypothetical protein